MTWAASRHARCSIPRCQSVLTSPRRSVTGVAARGAASGVDRRRVIRKRGHEARPRRRSSSPRTRAVRDTPFLVLTSVLIIAMSAGGAVLQSTAAGGRANTWTATTSTGATLSGTWTALYRSARHRRHRHLDAREPERCDPRARWVVGCQIVIRVEWHLASECCRRAERVSGGWSTAVDLGPGTAFGSLFEQAAEAVVSGRWRSGGQSGAWSIRAYK